ncbi:MAG: hypothetical protein M3P51_08595 [Chloroflexota bacterium]|nr:hypothetical protein [Chloroflexota bacterium]
MSNTIDYGLGMPPSEALSRIQSAVDDEHRSLTWTGQYSGTQPFLGSVSRNTFRIRRRRSHRNGFAPILFGEVHSEAGGSRVTGKFRMPLGTRWALGLLSLFVLVVLSILFITDVRRIGLDTSQLWILVMGVLIGGGWYLTMQVGFLLAREDKRTIRHYLDDLFSYVQSCNDAEIR